jgi:hypothetical protein
MESLLIPDAAIDRAQPPREELDSAIATLQGNKNAWFEMPLQRKIEYAKSIHRRTHEVTRSNLGKHIAFLYVEKKGRGKVALVLGAGEVGASSTSRPVPDTCACRESWPAPSVDDPI